MVVLPKQIEIALELIENNGFEAYIVGGCVRDFVLGTSSKDIDIATNALPEDIMRIFAEYKLIPIGIKYGTITVGIDGIYIEITTYREDGEYLDNRRPNNVLHTQNITSDLARRDFTMNAIAYHPQRGFLDPFDGVLDIKNKIIRAVGTPQKRFEEDALRILRGIRFSSTLDLEIEEETLKAMFEKKQLLENISSERIYTEFCKTLLGKNVKSCFLKTAEIWGVVLPEILPMVNFNQNNYHHIYDVFTHTLVALENTPPILHLRLATFFHDVGKPSSYTEDEDKVGHFYGHPKISESITDNILNRLKVSNNTKSIVLMMIKHHDDQIAINKKSVKKYLSKISPELFFDFIALKKADNLAQSPEYQDRQEELKKVEKIAKEILEDKECFSKKDLKINGRDLIDVGYKGKGIAQGLEIVLKKVIDEEVENDREKLLELIKNLNID